MGHLKHRFHVLHGEVRVTLENTHKIVVACAMLHGICKARNIDLPPEDDEGGGGGDDNGFVDAHNPHPVAVPAAAVRSRGLHCREEFVMAHFK